VFTSQNEFGGFRASNRDITERKQVEEALYASREEAEMLASKLLSAQEAERARLARELHDDISQRLAFLNVEVDKVEMKGNTFPEPIRRSLRQISQGLGTLSSDLSTIARRLHPTTLDILGLVRAVEDECQRFSRARDISASLDLDSTIKPLPKEISLCAYRVPMSLT
jgi:signal transduction histidine kinase